MFENLNFSKFAPCHGLKSKIPKSPKIYFNIQMQSLHERILYREAVWSRVMFENLNFSLNCRSPLPPFKIKNSKIAKMIFWYLSLVTPCAISSS